MSLLTACHSKLSMDPVLMTRRMVLTVCNDYVNLL